MKLGYLGVFVEIIEQALNLSIIHSKDEGFHHLEGFDSKQQRVQYILA